MLKRTMLAFSLTLFAFGAQAKTHHRAHHHHWAHHKSHHRHFRHHARIRFRATSALAYAPATAFPDPIGTSLRTPVVAEAKRFLGTNPTGQRTLWCADFANLVLRKLGMRGTGSRLAKSFLRFPAARPAPNTIAILGRRGGGHVGFVAGFDAHGNPIIVSGNSGGRHGRRYVTEHVYPRQKVIRYVHPV